MTVYPGDNLDLILCVRGEATAGLVEDARVALRGRYAVSGPEDITGRRLWVVTRRPPPK